MKAASSNAVKTWAAALLTAGIMALSFNAAAAEEAAAEENAGEAMDQMIKDPEIGYYVMRPDFTTNLAGSAGGRLHYIRISVSIMVGDDRDIELLKEKDPLIRDSIVSLLGAKDYASVSTAEGRELLRQSCRKHLMELINEREGRDVIEDVLFTNYIYQ